MLEIAGLDASYGRARILRGVGFGLARGEVLALMGRNGAGKSTLLATLAGVRTPDAGTVRLRGRDPRALVGHALISTVGLVPQEPADLLYASGFSREDLIGKIKPHTSIDLGQQGGDRKIL